MDTKPSDQSDTKGEAKTMNTTVAQRDETLRQVFKKFNPFMVLMWRLGLGRWINIWPAVIGRIMVIRHTGRKSGLPRYTPVNYANINGEIYCLAGFGSKSDWYQNILANPQVEVWLPGRRFVGSAEDISAAENRLQIIREVIIASGFAAALAGINAKKMSDEDLERETKIYRLLHIRPQAEMSGKDGPGDLAWVWLPILLIFLSISKRRRHK
jgi:deazaflavin-dependent oxidoreductase (nitroreductase family)